MNAYVHYHDFDDFDINKMPSFKQYKVNIVLLRDTFVFGILLMFSRISYFMGLVDQLAPLLSIIYQIFMDISHFMFILLFTGFAFALSFYILGRSQMNFDNIQEYDLTLYPIKYKTFTGAIWYIVDIFWGNITWSEFDLGDKSQQPMLYLVFCLTTFMIMIHYLNMLIAIMGNTFEVRKGIQEEIKTQSHLRFVLDNWFLLRVAFWN